MCHRLCISLNSPVCKIFRPALAIINFFLNKSKIRRECSIFS